MSPPVPLVGMTCTKDLPEPVAPDAILAFFNQYNEALRLPYLLDYYRALGVSRFYVVDNASTDGSRDWLAQQPDVCLYETAESFVGNRCGLNWLEALRNRYGADHWCLTIDADELFVYPFCEQIPLPALAQYLDSVDAEAMLSLMIDCYPKGPLRAAQYEPGTAFGEASPYFDRSGYYLRPDSPNGLVGAYGGPRYRVFFDNGAQGRGPVLRKVPFVKWVRGACYTSVNHAVGRLRFAQVTGAVLHYKFLHAFDQQVEEAVAHGDRSEANFYTPAQKVLQAQPDLSLYGKLSERYTDSLQLCKWGLVHLDPDLAHFAARWMRQNAPDPAGSEPQDTPKDGKRGPRSDGIKARLNEGLRIHRRRKQRRKVPLQTLVDQWGRLSNIWRS